MNISERFSYLQNHKPGILDQDTYFRSAVALPLVDYRDKICLLFEKRAAGLKKQPGEICFPGGKIEKSDRDEAAAALRECCEELGLESADIELIAPLHVLVQPYKQIIYPYLCTIKDVSKIKPSADEVDSLIYIPLEELATIVPIHKQIELKPQMPEDYPYELIPNGKDYSWLKAYDQHYFYLWHGYTIWGMTARILRHLLTKIK